MACAKSAKSRKAQDTKALKKLTSSPISKQIRKRNLLIPRMGWESKSGDIVEALERSLRRLKVAARHDGRGFALERRGQGRSFSSRQDTLSGVLGPKYKPQTNDPRP